MILKEERLTLNGHEILLRSAKPDDASMLKDYLKTVSGETRFLSKEADEVTITDEQEAAFIEKMSSPRNLLIIAFFDGEYAGNCSFDTNGESRRNAHRAGLGIALFEKFTGKGLGSILMEKALKCAKELGYTQMELTVVSANERAKKLYESFGFKEYGRLPNANKYDDGTFSDDIFMLRSL